MGKHTPGPWQVNDGDPLQVCDADGEVRGCAPIARVAQTGQPKPRAEDLANASLIAVAPELLAEVRKSADTFAELAQAFRIFGYPTAAQACLVAEESNRVVLAKAEAA